MNNLWESYEKYLEQCEPIRRGWLQKQNFMSDTYFNEWLKDGWIKELT